MKFGALWLALATFAAASPFHAVSPVPASPLEKRSSPKPLEKRANSVIIGYRTIDGDAAALIQKSGNTLVFDPNRKVSSNQLGPGAYLSPSLGEWPGGNDAWYCAILADESIFNGINKVWVPESAATDTCGGSLWYKYGDTNRPIWIREKGGPDYTIDNTILLSPIHGYETTKVQFLIPPALLAYPSNPLNNKALCVKATDTEAWEALKALYGTVDWQHFPGLKAFTSWP